MITSVLAAVRRNAVASLALTVAVLALAGGAYAAFRLPAGSVTDRAIRNHTITPTKLNTSAAHSFGGYVRDWASVTAGGTIASANRQAFDQAVLPAATNGDYEIAWSTGGSSLDPIGGCVPEVTVQGSTANAAPGAFATAIPNHNVGVVVHTYGASGAAAPEGFYLAVVC